MIYLGIDPGVSGGIAALESDGGIVLVGPMPATDEDVYCLFSELARNAKMEDQAIVAAIEHVWSTPGQGGAFKFGMSIGMLRAMLTANRIPYDPVLPKKWQKALGVTYAPGLTDTQKKNITKARAQQLFPGVKITHAIADALLIAEHCRRSKDHRHGEASWNEGTEEDREGRE